MWVFWLFCGPAGEPHLGLFWPHFEKTLKAFHSFPFHQNIKYDFLGEEGFLVKRNSSPTCIFFSDKPNYCVCNTSCCFRHLRFHTHIVLLTWKVSLFGDKSSILLDSPKGLFPLSILSLPPPGPDPWPIPLHVKDK